MEQEVGLEDFRAVRLRKEQEFYLSDKGFIDFVRDSGAAPDATFQPHGRYCQELIQWEGEPDPDNPNLTIYKWKMTLWPRGSFKSAVFDVGQIVWLIAKDPNVRILLCSETARQAKRFAQQVMKIVDSEWFRERFGIHRGREHWTPGSGAFTSALRSQEFAHRKEPTLQASGVGEVQTGAHWDYVFMDDVCSQENTRTPEAIESLWFWFGETLAQLDPGCKLFVIGTLHHYSDIYCRIQKTPAMRKLFDISVHSWKNEKTEELFFPERLTNRFVENQKLMMPPRLYACFYENKPMTMEQQLFKPSYFRVIPDADVPRDIWTYILTDFAFKAEEKKKDRPDRTAFWVIALDANRVAYVLDFYVGMWVPSDSVRIVCDLWNRYQWANLKGVSVEDTTHKELLSSVFEEVRRQTFTKPRLIPIQGRSQEVKDYRIEASEPRYRRGDIWFAQSLRSNMRKWRPLIEEMTEWPFSTYDDIPDAQSDLDKKNKDGGYFLPNPPVGYRANVAEPRHKPTLVDGQYNPRYGYPAREFIKSDQHDPHNHDLWRNTRSTHQPTPLGGEAPQESGSIFQRPPQRPTPLDRF